MNGAVGFGDSVSSARMAEHAPGDAPLRCNVSSCRQPLLSGAGWVTFCRHVFCDPCGAAAARRGACPACTATLGAPKGPRRTRRFAVSPRPEEVAMLVAGLRPRTILAACSAGMACYLQQTEEEGRLQEGRIGKLGDRLNRVEQYHEQVVLQFKARVTELELELAARDQGGQGAARDQDRPTANLLAMGDNQGSTSQEALFPTDPDINFAAFDAPTRAMAVARRASYSCLPGLPSQAAWRQRGPRVARAVPRSAPSLDRPGPLF